MLFGYNNVPYLSITFILLWAGDKYQSTEQSGIWSQIEPDRFLRDNGDSYAFCCALKDNKLTYVVPPGPIQHIQVSHPRTKTRAVLIERRCNYFFFESRLILCCKTHKQSNKTNPLRFYLKRKPNHHIRYHVINTNLNSYRTFQGFCFSNNLL